MNLMEIAIYNNDGSFDEDGAYLGDGTYEKLVMNKDDPLTLDSYNDIINSLILCPDQSNQMSRIHALKAATSEIPKTHSVMSSLATIDASTLIPGVRITNQEFHDWCVERLKSDLPAPAQRVEAEDGVDGWN